MLLLHVWKGEISPYYGEKESNITQNIYVLW